jgi:riboflavin synthase
MFTGLVEHVGKLSHIEEVGDARRLTVEVADETYLQDAEIGESISVNGTCLTVVSFDQSTFNVEAVEETLRRTTLGQKQVGDHVNLERALRANARLGGHIVQGHIDGVATLDNIRDEGESWWVTFEPPFELMRYIVEKGSICIDGISLTVANVAYRKFSVALIPHSREVTTAGEWQAGSQVNLETDVIAKYVERLTQFSMNS